MLLSTIFFFPQSLPLGIASKSQGIHTTYIALEQLTIATSAGKHLPVTLRSTNCYARFETTQRKPPAAHP
jgi:hypothetical protein